MVSTGEQAVAELTNILECHTIELGLGADYEGACECGWIDKVWAKTRRSVDNTHFQHVAEMILAAGATLDTEPITGDRVLLTTANMPQVVAWVRGDGLGKNWAAPSKIGVHISIGNGNGHRFLGYGDWLVRLGSGDYTILAGVTEGHRR